LKHENYYIIIASSSPPTVYGHRPIQRKKAIRLFIYLSTFSFAILVSYQHPSTNLVLPSHRQCTASVLIMSWVGQSAQVEQKIRTKVQSRRGFQPPTSRLTILHLST